MTQEEKINRLAELFAKLNEIKKEIADLIGDPKTKPAKTRQTKPIGKKAKKEVKAKRKWTRTGKTNSPGLRDNRLKKMYCIDCQTVFETTLSKLDATCTECGSTHVSYASTARK